MTIKRYTEVTREVAHEMYQRRMAGAGWDDIVREFRMGPETAKRAMALHGLEHTPPPVAAGVDADIEVTEMWTRKCLKCGETHTLRKWMYLCSRCKRLNARDHNGSDKFFVGARTSGGRRGGVKSE